VRKTQIASEVEPTGGGTRAKKTKGTKSKQVDEGFFPKSKDLIEELGGEGDAELCGHHSYPTLLPPVLCIECLHIRTPLVKLA